MVTERVAANYGDGDIARSRNCPALRTKYSLSPGSSVPAGGRGCWIRAHGLYHHGRARELEQIDFNVDLTLAVVEEDAINLPEVFDEVA